MQSLTVILLFYFTVSSVQKVLCNIVGIVLVNNLPEMVYTY